MKRPSTKPSRFKNSQVTLNTRPPIQRIQQILNVLKKERFPSRLDLANELEVTTKTIQRDIDFLRDRMKAPISYNRMKSGYTLTGPVEGLPRMELTQSELFSIYVAQKALQAYRGTAFEAPLRNAFNKLGESLDGHVSVSLTEMEASLSFRQFEARPVELKIFQTVATAVQKQRVLEIEYQKLDAKKPQKRKIEPYHLACVQGQWYCIAHDLKSHDFRTFHLGRIKFARLLINEFVRPKSFSIEKHLAGSLGIYRGKSSHKVVLHFDRWSAQFIRERTWHPSQKIQELTHGEVELSLHLNSLEEVEPWVMSWGFHVKVLEPNELVKKIVNAAQQITKQYAA